jgi:hypothetical protein
MKTKRYNLTCLLCVWVISIAAISLQGQTFKAVNDTIDLTPGIQKTINILANDIIPSGDSIRIYGAGSVGYGTVVRTALSGGNMTYLAPGWGFSGNITGNYYLMDLVTHDTSRAIILFRVHDNSYDSLYLNNINARFSASGNHFIAPENYFTGAQFEVPKFSGKSTIFLNTLWMGGLADDSILHLAALMYGQGPNIGPAMTYRDYWAGPVMDSAAYSIYQDTVWNYIWNLKKTEIEYHKAHWIDSGYEPIRDILTWPGNGQVSLGQAAELAPFFDRNNDGNYDPYDGDYPLIRGDQALFFIFNDDRNIHLESGGKKMKVEIHGMAYAFDLPGDSAFNNTIFLNYRIFNRSANTYKNTFMGLFTDFDIGFSSDDYIGCDVERSSYYGYNGDLVDGNGEPWSYGAHPPAQSVTLLGGPYLDPDDLDNPRFDDLGHQLCNESLNGMNFGDSIVDNERYGMSRFIYTNNSNSGVPLYMQDPSYYQDYYKTLQGIWRDGTKMIYGGNGHVGAGGYGPECNFMFPGESDSLNWGVGCIPPNGAVNWTEKTAQNNPSDRRGVGSMGPFTFLPGAVQDLDIAFTFARDYVGNDSINSISKLLTFIDTIRSSFAMNKLSNGNSFNGIENYNNASSLSVKIYPNPANTFINIEWNGNSREKSTIRIINFTGSLVASEEKNPHAKQVKINISDLPTGLYLVNIQSGSQTVTKKVSIMR